ncbi:discoidin domain-containing protein [Paenibacillus sp. N4]|uniref:OmpL47-type beta-barrel domain-containing protein n=1 Tax=Paenibacillus vietnamensis TaxID=2590547 RepID=UPI001CD0C105|nr:discoidin domain-containing protein [Paenibacillus vietnamensis]MCA0755414.1 discoidin domain-containing protein [Paenibacillus vietnamensis]
MKLREGFYVGIRFRRRLLSIVVSISLLAAMLPLPAASAAEETAEQPVIGEVQPVIYEVIDESGFKHPGVGLTKDILENVREQVRAQKEPWVTYFNQMQQSPAASKTVTSSNQNGADPTKPASDAFNSQGFNSRFIADGLKSYTQALMYVITGDEVYRSNALRIIRIWSQMDPAKYAYFTDAHIHTGIPLNRMVTAAEILRYTGTQTEELKWTEQDTDDFTNHLIIPVIETFQHTNDRFMNQHLYSLLGAVSGYIFTGNRDRYNERVEWFTVNKTAVDQGQNGAIKALFRLVDTNILTGEKVEPSVVQHVEMGRDQAHGAGDVTNAEILSRLLLAQGTKVDPVDGTASTAPDAVGPYEFLDNRILKASDYFARYMLGYDTPWIPVAAHTDIDGNPTIVYKQLAGGYRGRIGGNVYDLYYYYKYTAGIDMETEAPYFTEMFEKRLPFYWESPDGGGDYWLYIPKEAEAEGTRYIPKAISSPDLREVEDRYTSLNGVSSTRQEGGTAFVQLTATEEGSRIALVGSASGERTIAFKIRTDGTAKLEVFGDSVTLPDTKGQWKYVSYAFNPFQGLGDLVYMTVKGAGTTVELDHIHLKAGAQLTPPVFTQGKAPLQLFTYTGSTADIRYDFGATDAGAADVVAYQADHLPAGAAFDVTTGAFSWHPAQAGTYSFVISASDGTSVTTRDVTIVVAGDRQSAIDAVIAPYDAGTLYVSSTLAHYNDSFIDAESHIASASDEVFYQKLFALNAAVQSLQVLTPLLKDGSVDFTNMFVSSTFGNAVPNLLDHTNDSFVGYYTAQDRTHYMDFGPDYKLSATAFELQVRASFPERIGGVAIFGSNDKEHWIRLTPGLTTVTEDMQRLEVEDSLEQQPFRFLKMQMIEPSSTMLEAAEFRIFGRRHETVNKLESVSVGSEQSLKNRIVPGDTIKLSFQSSEPIQDVSVNIQGQAAAVTTADNQNWTAALTTNRDVQAGAVKFRISYKTAAGAQAEDAIFTTDGSSLFIADQTGFLSNVLEIANLTDSSGRNPADLLATAKALFDGNLGTVTDFRLNGSGYGAYLTFDFKEGGQALLSRVEIIARQDSYSGRINGTVVQGSNDNATWTTISNAAGSTADWQTLKINSTAAYRYIRITNGNNWFGNMAELRLYGDVKIRSKLDSVSIGSEQSIQKRIVPGNKVQLVFKATEKIHDVGVNIHGQTAAASSDDQINWKAEAVIGSDASPGPVTFSIHYKTEDGSAGPEKTTTSDGSSLYLPDRNGLLSNVLEIADLKDSSGRNPADLLKTAGALFDGNAGTITDFRVNGSGSGGYLTFEFKEGYQATLSKAELLSRQDGYFTRINGTVVQGSNDQASWTTISAAAGRTMDWQTLTVNSKKPYRYIRIYNGSSWFGNMAELRLYGEVKAADVTPPVTTDDAPQGWAAGDTVVTFHASDESSGVEATYFTVNEGEQQTGGSVTLTGEGTHTIVYWSTDAAGNVEPSRSVEVKIDRTAPQVEIAGEASYTIDQTVTVTCHAADALSGVDSSPCDAPLADTKAYTLEPGEHSLTAEAEDEAGNRGSAQHSFSVHATFDSLSALTGAFAAETGDPGSEGIVQSLQQKLELAEAKAGQQNGTAARNLLQAYIGEVNALSGKRFTAEQAAALGRWAQRLHDETLLAGGTPGI